MRAEETSAAAQKRDFDPQVGPLSNYLHQIARLGDGRAWQLLALHDIPHFGDGRSLLDAEQTKFGIGVEGIGREWTRCGHARHSL
jgi:hypothetical protein